MWASGWTCGSLYWLAMPRAVKGEWGGGGVGYPAVDSQHTISSIFRCVQVVKYLVRYKCVIASLFVDQARTV